MKNYATFVMALYKGIYEDAAIRWPDTRSMMEKDLSYLRRAFEQRGLSFFTLTLPDYGKWIDRSLDHGSFVDLKEVPRGIPYRQGRPVLFRGVLKKVFDNSGMLRSDADHEAVLYVRTLCQSLGKLEMPVKRSAQKKTVKEFFDVEQHLPGSHPDTWDCEIPIWASREGHPLWGRPSNSRVEPNFFGSTPHLDPRVPWHSLRQLCRRVTSELGTPMWESLRSKHGPGVTSEKWGGSKYEFPNWSRKLELFFPFDMYGSGQLNPDFEPCRKELASRLIAVPKTMKGPRLICAEPLANQWMQQGIWDWLRRRISATTLGRSITFESQARSQEWALLASHDRSKATLDLSEASDRLSTRLVEYIFQGSEILDGMHACRTRSMKQSLESELPKLTLLRKFATMGSALTFPVQSVVFTILSVWALRLSEKRENDWVDWKADFDRVRVFGDDIIVPSHAYRFTKLVLHECGLVVNTRKSFGGVSFRESCGMDAFRGVDVTPARHRQLYDGSASSTAALVEYTNNLFEKGMWYASESVLRCLPKQERKLLWVGHRDDSRLGLVSFQKQTHDVLRRTKWDADLQRAYAVRLAFTARTGRTLGEGRGSLTQYFTEFRTSIEEEPSIEDCNLSQRSRLRRRLAGGTTERSRDLHVPGLCLGSVRGSRSAYSIVDLREWSSGRTTVARLRKQRVRVYL